MRPPVLPALCLLGMLLHGCPASEVADTIECEQNSDCETFSCTDTRCEAHKCVQDLKDDFCQIDGACIAIGSLDPNDQCKICDPVRSTDTYSGVACEDGKICDSSTGCYWATGDCQSDADCQSDPGACVLPRCVGGECTLEGGAPGASCDDGVWCNGVEACDAQNPAADENGCVLGSLPAVPEDPDPTDCLVFGDCDEGEKRYALVPADAETACDDGVSCTETDVCNDSGICAGTANHTSCTSGEWCAETGCNAVTPVWQTGDWEACEGDAPVWVETQVSECSGQKNAFVYGAWSACDTNGCNPGGKTCPDVTESCGEGTQVRTESCEPAAGEIEVSSVCEPVAGMQVRTAQCEAEETGEALDEAACVADDKPLTEQDCFLTECDDQQPADKTIPCAVGGGNDCTNPEDTTQSCTVPGCCGGEAYEGIANYACVGDPIATELTGALDQCRAFCESLKAATCCTLGAQITFGGKLCTAHDAGNDFDQSCTPQEGYTSWLCF